MSRMIKRALISVSDKTNLDAILSILAKKKVSIISSGGTYKYIKNKGFKCTEISDFTNFDEMLDGRVKTLHPKIHAGILFNRKKNSHISQMKKKGYEQIDLIIVNFYPFKETLKKSKSEKKIVEYIDIGGPSLVRAAAKNFNDVTVIVDKNDYSNLENELKKNKGKTSLMFRKKMASKAFGLTAFYDSVVSEWFNQNLKINFPKLKTVFGEKLSELRYGENPHQKSSIYLNNLTIDILDLKKIKKGSFSFSKIKKFFNLGRT